MANVFDYLSWRGDLLFTQDGPNAVDALVFSTLAYLHFDGAVARTPENAVRLSEAAEEFLQLPDALSRCRMKNDLLLLKAAAQTARYANAQIVQYREHFDARQDIQFAAVTFLLDDGSAFLAFRGTDNTLTGWKEDFNMSFCQTIPSQLLAAEYTRNISERYAGQLFLCGHSKGGNLAVFAAAKSEPGIQHRIKGVYNLDGPGFSENMMGDPGYRAMVPQIHTFVPQSSVIGLLMEHEEPYTIIHSTQLSLMQHDTFSWEVKGREFVTMEEITPDSRFLNAAIKSWLKEMDTQERSRLVDAMFSVLTSGETQSAGEIFHPKNIRNYIKILESDEKTRKILTEEFANFLEAALRTGRMQNGEHLMEERSEWYKMIR